MKKIAIFLAAVLLMFSGCSGNEAPKMNLYCVNEKCNGLDTVKVDITDSNPVETATELIKDICDISLMPKGDSPVIPDGISISSCTVEDDIIHIDLSGDYGSLSPSVKLLLTAGLTKTFEQINGIDGVNITIKKQPLLDTEGKELGILSDDEFVIHSGDEINTYSRMQMTLYFPDGSGTIVPETRTVYYKSSVPTEQLVMQELIKGPYEAGHQSLFASNANFLNVNIQKKICYVNFDESISQALSGYDVNKALQAIVRSMSSVCGIDKVQFSVNGDTAVEINGVSINKIFEA
ncbi:MAG: GerMN domain-containing protein [Lachnospiraceae bacterium]|nr:GerMN domain-containing protein [Lachnospiraceae bacterium]